MTIKTVLTSNGYAKVLNAMTNGAALSITHMAISDHETAPVPAMTALDQEVWRGSVDSVAADPNAPQQIIVRATVPAEVGGWTARAIGLFDDENNLIVVGSIAAVEKIADFVSITLTVVFALNEHEVEGISLTPEGSYIHLDEKGSNGGVATLDDSGKVPESQLPAMPGNGAGLPIVEWDMTAQAFAAELSLFGTGPLIGQGYGIATTTSTKDYEISGIAGQLASGMAGIGNGFPMGTKKCIVWIPGVLEESPPNCVAYASNVVLVTNDAANPLTNCMQVTLGADGDIYVITNNVTTLVDAAYVIGQPVLIGVDTDASTVWVKTANAESSFVFPVTAVQPALIGGVLVYQSQAGTSTLTARLSADEADLGELTLMSDFELLTDDLVSLPPNLIAPTLLKVIVSGNYYGVPYSIGDAAVFVGGDVVVPSGATGAQVAGLMARMAEAEKVTTKALEISVTDYTNLTGSDMTTDGTVPVSSNTKDITVNCGNAGNLLHLAIFPPPNTVPGITSVGRAFCVTFTRVNADGFVWVSTSSQGFGGTIQPFAVTSGDSVEFVYSEYTPGNFGYVISEQVRNLNVGNKTWLRAYNLHDVAEALSAYNGRQLTIATTGAHGFACDSNAAEDFSNWGKVLVTQDTAWSDLNQDFHVKGNIVLQEITGFVRSFKSYGALTTRNLNVTLYDTGTAYIENLKMKEYPASFTRQAGQTFDINGILRDETVGAIQQELQVNLAPTYGGNHCALVLSGPCEVNTIRIAAGHLKVTGDAKVGIIVNENTGALTELIRVSGTARLNSVECGTNGVTTAVVVDKGVVFANTSLILGTFTDAFSQVPLEPTANGQIHA